MLLTTNTFFGFILVRLRFYVVLFSSALLEPTLENLSSDYLINFSSEQRRGTATGHTHSLSNSPRFIGCDRNTLKNNYPNDISKLRVLNLKDDVDSLQITIKADSYSSDPVIFIESLTGEHSFWVNKHYLRTETFTNNETNIARCLRSTDMLRSTDDMPRGMYLLWVGNDQAETEYQLTISNPR